MKQPCVAQSEVPPDEATYLFDREYTVTVGGRVYDSEDSTVYKELPPNTYIYYIPAANFTLESLDDSVKDRQIVSADTFEFAATSLNSTGTAKQSVIAGFEVNPYDENANDMLGFLFELDAPEDALKEGKIVYQYVTYKKADNITIPPISIGCKTKVGDPYVSEVKTFNGTNSLSSESSFVKNRTWSQQNSEDKAKKKDSYGLSQESVFYKKESSDVTGNSLQPCLAQIEF